MANHTTLKQATTAVTLVAATATDVLGSTTGICLVQGGVRTMQLMVRIWNTGGANAVTTISPRYSPTGDANAARWATDTDMQTSLGTIAASSYKEIVFDQFDGDYMRLVLTSTAGTTVEVEFLGYGDREGGV